MRGGHQTPDRKLSIGLNIMSTIYYVIIMYCRVSVSTFNKETLCIVERAGVDILTLFSYDMPFYLFLASFLISK
jgi:hypothetical protein